MSRYISIAEDIVGRHFRDQMPPDIRRLYHLAYWDLYNGPITEVDDDSESWPGFVTATALLGRWAEDNLSEVWYDTQTNEVLLSEPKGFYDEDSVDDETGEACWVEPYWEDFINFKLADVKRAVFGKELADY